MKKTRVGVVGCGVLGSRHAEIYSQIEDAELVGVFDIHAERAKELAAKTKSKSFNSLAELADACEAASIATPAQSHFEVARPLVEKGVHLLIEKPITTRLDEADELLRLARVHKVILQTGHVERFNGAIVVIKEMVKNPRFIECDRIGPYDPRIQDVGVVLDLMIHDIDIVLHLVHSPVKSVDTIAMRIHSDTEDFANCRITFENGTICNLTASRMARDRLRKIRIFQDDAYLSLDYFRQEAVILTRENGTPAYHTIDITKSQPLNDELKDFISCVRSKETPVVSGEDGRAALEVALRILDQIAVTK